MKKNGIRYFNFKSAKNAIINCFRSQPIKPPYKHICQLGDPVLRQKAAPVDTQIIGTREFQEMLEQLSNVLRKYNMSGVAAPQIGLSLQVFAIEVRKKILDKIDPEIQKFCEMEEVPLTFFINPVMEIKGEKNVMHTEMCGSILGYGADILRAREVEIKAFNRLGETFSWTAKGWPARIAQHEFDHLQGKLYIDKMDPSTFQCIFWEEINANKGKVEFRFYQK
ncbi:PREDICTED: peptide deformylase, mitochondrial-like [Dufourea novaeangliae]|uniref:peptide deformylase, mitochondrial-like n=1 Tax=Dufourea novaeangliae TaxID=178035 RepID=UPI0007679489|nr:PREDICTED: peptide deformylase, mitochondrial-like [Dufourea novaeangliae]